MQKRIAPPRIHHIAILGVLILFAMAIATGSVHRIAVGALAALIVFPA